MAELGPYGSNGSIEKRGKRSYRITVDLGRDEKDGRKRHRETIKGSKADARKRLMELLATIDTGMPIASTNANVSGFLQQWLKDYAEPNTSPQTYRGYNSLVNYHLIPKLGHIPLTKIRPQHIQNLHADMLRSGLSNRTVLHAYRVLHRALEHAVKWRLINWNPCDAVDAPRAHRTETTTLSIHDVKRLLEATAASRYRHIIYLAIETGLRRGELLGLIWYDIDLPNRLISVNRSLARVTGKGLVASAPKTRRSRRPVKISKKTTALLAGIKAQRREVLQAGGIDIDENSPVFSNSQGTPLSPDAVSHGFNRLIKQAGLPHLRFHDLRHIHAGLLIRQGIHAKVISDRLGHSSISITMDLYGNLIAASEEKAAEAVQEALQQAESIPTEMV